MAIIGHAAWGVALSLDKLILKEFDTPHLNVYPVQYEVP